jgi:hypothetical protein
MANSQIETEVARTMSSRELHCVCDNYEVIIAKLDADADSERISEIHGAIHVMEAELERRRVKAA